jgi:hypothetical protein
MAYGFYLLYRMDKIIEHIAEPPMIEFKHQKLRLDHRVLSEASSESENAGRDPACSRRFARSHCKAPGRPVISGIITKGNKDKWNEGIDVSFIGQWNSEWKSFPNA